MFKGKISYYRNADGKEEKVEQEFDDPREYRQFLTAHPEMRMWEPDRELFNWDIGLPQFANLWWALDDMVDRRMRFLTGSSAGRSAQSAQLPEGVNLERYEEEIKKMESEKKDRETARKSLQEACDRLSEYARKFEEAWNQEKAKQAREDLKKVEDQLKNP